MKIKTFIFFFVFCSLIAIGFFGVFTISHELYHFYSIGNPKGICLGVCPAIVNNSASTSFGAYYFIEDSPIDNLEERNAYIFCSIFTGSIFILLICLNKLRID